ncbi:MAG: VIT1/CCC1 transporter family protein [Rhodanobacteraceae bacterium]
MSAGTAVRYRRNLRIEQDNAALYSRLAGLADDEGLARAYQRIADIELANAGFWARRLKRMGAEVPDARPSLRVRVLSQLARWFGTGFVMPTVVRMEHADHAPTPVDRSEHRDHFPRSSDRTETIGRHRAQGGNTLRAAVLGANDGLVSNVSLVMGMAGAAASNGAVLLAGLAGLVAGACSMAMGEWLSVNSSREFYQAQITERAERLAVSPEDVRQHIRGIYRDKGLDEDEADAMSARLSDTPRATLDTLVREDLGIDPDELGGSAWGASISSFILFAFGALFPVAPYFWLQGTPALIGSACATLAGLILIALGSALFTGRGILFSVTRQFMITLAAASVTWLLGYLIGGQVVA